MRLRAVRERRYRVRAGGVILAASNAVVCSGLGQVVIRGMPLFALLVPFALTLAPMVAQALPTPTCGRGQVVVTMAAPSGEQEVGCVSKGAAGDVRQGVWRVYAAAGPKVSEGAYRDGKKHGAWRGWSVGGKLQWLATWKDGVEDGVWKGYFEDGKVEREAHFVAGKQDGPIAHFHPNGKKADRKVWKAGVLEGPVVAWDDKGRLRFEANYVAGKLDGWRRERCPNGKVYLATRYAAGVAVEGDLNGVPPNKIPCETFRGP